jgi:cytochrome P450
MVARLRRSRRSTPSLSLVRRVPPGELSVRGTLAPCPPHYLRFGVDGIEGKNTRMADTVIALSDFVADPDGVLRVAREHATVATTELGPIVVRHDAVRAMLQDARLRPSFSSFLEQMGISSGPFHQWMSGSPLDMEGEEHRRWRQLMARTFTPRSVERLRPFLRTESHRLVDAFPADGRCDFVEAFARTLPSLGLCELIGVPSQDRARFASLADTIGLGFNLMLLQARIADIDAATSELLDYARGLVVARRENPRDDLVTRIARAADEDEAITEDMVVGSIAGLVFAGHETTKNQLGWMIAVMSKVPAEWDKVASDPARAVAAVEEVLRFKSAATSLARVTTEDVELFGLKLAKGTQIVGSLWSANRDKAAFPNPDAFDPDQNKRGVQIAFGHGAHHCLGAALARAELQEALTVLAQRIECPRVLDGATFLPPVGINGPVTLPIEFTARPVRSNETR